MSNRDRPPKPGTPLVAGGDPEDGVRPNGQAVRRLRHERGWSPRALIDAIARASESETGLPRTLTPNQLSAIEEHDEVVPYDTLLLVSAAFDCDPVDLWSPIVAGDDDDEDDLFGPPPQRRH